MTTEYVGKEEQKSANPFAMVKREESGGMLEVASSRAAQEVQASMVIAKKFPRDEAQAFVRVMKACERPGLAEQASYSYPKGSTRVSGPSIRLAEEMVRHWGNAEAGVVELSRNNGESICLAYCVDLETNYRENKTFTVRHIRDRSESKGGNIELKDERDIYELIANMGARRKRACILAILPGDLVDAAEEKCSETIKKGIGGVEAALKKMLVAFDGIGVNKAMIEKKLGHKFEVTTADEIVQLRRIYKSIEDGMSKRDDWFDSNVQEVVKATTTVPKTEAPKESSTPKETEPAKEAPKEKKPAAKKDPAPSSAPIQQSLTTEPAGKSPLTTILEMTKRDGFTESEVLEVMISLGQAPEECTALPEVMDTVLLHVIEHWPAVKKAVMQMRVDKAGE